MTKMSSEEDEKSRTRYKSSSFEIGPTNKLNKKSKHLYNNLKKAYFGGNSQTFNSN